MQQLAGFQITDESPGTYGFEGYPTISAVVATYINVDSEPLGGNSTSNGASRTDILEALLNSALNSGTINKAAGAYAMRVAAALPLQAIP